MQINIKFFASLREELGSEGQTLESGDPLTIAKVWEMVTDCPPPDNLLCSRNLEYADWDELVQDGDEVAFFPPVTGG